MKNDRLFGLDADPPFRPNGRSDIQGVLSGNAVKQDKDARVFAVIAILLFACYFIGALAANAQEKSAVVKHGTEQPAVGSSMPRPLRLQVDVAPNRAMRVSLMVKLCVGIHELSICPSHPMPTVR